MVDSMARGGRTGTAGSNATDMANAMVGMQMGMAMAGQMAGAMNQMNNAATQTAGTGTAPKFCPTVDSQLTVRSSVATVERS